MYKPVANELSVHSPERGYSIVIRITSFMKTHPGKTLYRSLRHYKMSREGKIIRTVAKHW